YHLLTGLQLFPHSNPAVVISRHLNTTPLTLSERRPNCASLDDVLRMALAKNPQQRFPACSAFAWALADELSASGAASASASTQAAPTTPKSASTSAARSPARPPAGLPRRIWVVAGSVAVIILVIVVVALGLRFSN